jgi:Cu-Zn family superoxide dismutase
MEAFPVGLTLDTVFDEDGSALIVHADPDDYVTQPGGASGDRIACAVIEAGGDAGAEREEAEVTEPVEAQE